MKWLVFQIVLVIAPAVAAAETEDPHAEHSMSHTSHGSHEGHDMTFDATGMVMNGNADELPKGCAQMGPDREFTVHAGIEYAAEHSGTIFGMSQHEWQVEPCSRVTVTFVNEDEVRHQWMVHGLPRYLYPQGMFHIEAAGGARQTGTFIVPSGDRTYLVHCDMAQHMEKGMKGQLKVGAGSGDLWAIPGISTGFYRDSYLAPGSWRWIALSLLVGVAVVVAGALLARGR